MSVSTCKIIKGELQPQKPHKRYLESIYPQANCPTYKKPIVIGCRYCQRKKGRKKNYKRLWALYIHFCQEHKDESSYYNHTLQLAELIIRGVLL